MTARPDVAVVGAGVAGLRAASILAEEGLEVLVLEARPSVGGRLLSRPARTAPDWAIDHGGELVGRQHTAVQALCARFGLSLVGFEAGGGGLLPAQVVHRDRRLSERARRRLDRELATYVDALCALAVEVDPVSPWRSQNAALAEIPVEDWMRQQGFSVQLTELFCDHAPRSQTLLALLAMVSAGGGQDYFYGAESSVIRGGAGQLAQGLAAELGGRIRLGHAVSSVTPVARGVEVAGTAAGAPFHIEAATCVVATPPACWPHGVRPLAVAPQMTHNRKIVLELRRQDPEAELSGLSDGPCRLAWPSPQLAEDPGRDHVLVSMLALPTGRAPWMSKAQLALEAMALLDLDAGDLRAVHEERWDRHRHSRGTYPVYGPAALKALAQAQAGGPVFHAGDWLMPGWSGSIEGAVRSGERAAAGLLAHLAASAAPVRSFALPPGAAAPSARHPFTTGLIR